MPMPLETEEDGARFIQRMRQYLEIRNLTVLLGNGCSLPFGSPRIDDVSKIKSELNEDVYRLKSDTDQKKALAILDIFISKTGALGVEPLLTILANIRANEELLKQGMAVSGSAVPAEDALCLERLLKKWLFLRCRALSSINTEKLKYHQELFRRILLRSTALPRARIFTLNYDLLVERALDNIGVLYFDGFLGTINRTLRTESYHYDLYFPGETTEGRVSRVDRVLHLCKLHGSINWRRRSDSVSDVIISHTEPGDEEYGDVMVYPSPLKLAEMNGYPYSEMFRHFNAQIHQPQSVLLVIGYRFQDSHVNRLIYQALSIPSFVLIIVAPQLASPKASEAATEAHEIWRLTQLDSKRIIVVVGGEKDGGGQYVSGAGTLQEFSTKWMPDISELNIEAAARNEANAAVRTSGTAGGNDD